MVFRHSNERYSTAVVADCSMAVSSMLDIDMSPEYRLVLCGWVVMLTTKPRWISASSGMVCRSLWGSWKTGISAGMRAGRGLEAQSDDDWYIVLNFFECRFLLFGTADRIVVGRFGPLIFVGFLFKWMCRTNYDCCGYNETIWMAKTAWT